jgi:tetratricopeptide (TPR) repeat protein
MVPVYWLVHGSVDWLWELPALGAAAFAMLGLAAGAAPRPQEPGRPAGGRARTATPARVALGLACAAAALGLLLPWLAERDMRRAARDWERSPDAAFQRLDRAKALNPFASRPYLYEATIAMRLGRIGPAGDAFAEALERNPRDWYATLELGAIASMRGDERTATRLLQRAARLLPRDPVTRDALRRVRSGRRVDVRRINARLREGGRKLVAPR